VVNRILGHKNSRITQSFQHAIPCLHEEAIDRFANLLDSVGGI
jgi:hypothetical protein